MKLDTVKLALYKYRMKSLVLTIGSGSKATKYTVDNSLILKMSMISDYEKEIFPFFTITISVPNKIYRKMIKSENKNNITVNMHLQKGKFTDALAVDNSKTVSFRDAIKETFHAIMGPKSPDLTESEQEVVEKGENQYGQLSSITMALYQQSFYDTYQIVSNAVLEKVTLTDCIVYILNKAKIKNVLMSPANNTKSYSQFKILPLQAYKMLIRICDIYALHDKGTIVFFDYDRAYIVEKAAKCTAYEKNEYKLTYIVVATSSQASRMVGGAYINSEKKYNVINSTSISTDDSSDVTKKTVGSNIVTVNSSGGVTKTNGKATKITNVLIQNEGDSTAKAITRTMKESKKTIQCQMENMDITMLKPNKQFIISVEGTKYKKYNGKYRLRACSYAFEKEGDYFSVTGIATLSGE
jgi:hypothetical protein